MVTARRAVLLAVFCLIPAGLAHADDPPPGLRSAVRQINSEKKVIMAFMYPTVTLDGIEADGYRLTASGFDIDVIFDYSDKSNNTGWVKVTFGFDKDGNVKSVRASKWSDFFPPFGLAQRVYEKPVSPYNST